MDNDEVRGLGNNLKVNTRSRATADEGIASNTSNTDTLLTSRHRTQRGLLMAYETVSQNTRR